MPLLQLHRQFPGRRVNWPTGLQGNTHTWPGGKIVIPSGAGVVRRANALFHSLALMAIGATMLGVGFAMFEIR